MTFSTIYRTNAWHGDESRSGPGSGSVATAAVARDILDLVADLGVQSVLDVACGDGFWMPALPGYLGVDVAPEAVAIAAGRHPGREYVAGDVRDLELGAFDLVILRDAVQHLPLAEGLAVVQAIRATGSTWLLASTFLDGENVDIAAGDAYSPDLTAAPFVLGDPARWIFDGYGYAEGQPIVRDERKHLGLWRL